MDKNLILAVSLSILVYIGWFKFIDAKYGKNAPPPGGYAEGQARPSPAAPPEDFAGTGAPSRPSRPARPATGPGAAAVGPAEPLAAAERGGREGAVEFRVGKLEGLIQPYGAGLVSYRYPGPLGLVELIEDPHPGFFASWPEVRFKAVKSDPNWPAFEGVLPSGAVARKEYLFQDIDGIQRLKITISNPTGEPVAVPGWGLSVGPGIGTVASEEKENASTWGAVALAPPAEGKKAERFLELKAADEPQRSEDEVIWLGVHNRYFLSAVFPPRDAFRSYSHGAAEKEILVPSWTGGKKKSSVPFPWISAEAAPATVPPGGSLEIEVPFYFGPKGYTHLKSLGHGMERSVSFGWFNRLGRFMMKLLHRLYGWTGNWGWAIILMTILLQVVMFPLTYKQTKSMAVMKKIQPEIARIQAKFKKDPQRLQVEMMQVYKKHGANPLSGCLPIVVQMPVFIALFNMLRGSWELHGAPWVLWIHDLSAKDPVYVLPILMGAVMFFQNKLNPQPSTDPNQAKIMQYLPVIFTFMFLNFPSGLVLYWLTNSLLSFGQQVLIKRRLEA